MRKKFLNAQETINVDNIAKSVEDQIVYYIKRVYHVEFTNLNGLAHNVVNNVINNITCDKNVKYNNLTRVAEKWFKLSGIKKGEFHQHSLFGFARNVDFLNYTFIIPKDKLVSGLKYWLATKLFKQL